MLRRFYCVICMLMASTGLICSCESEVDSRQKVDRNSGLLRPSEPIDQVGQVDELDRIPDESQVDSWETEAILLMEGKIEEAFDSARRKGFNKLDKEHGMSFVNYVMLEDDPEMMKRCVSEGASLLTTMPGGAGLLHLASYDQPEMVSFLIEQGLDVNGLTADGRTPLHFAVDAADPECTRLLLSKGARLPDSPLDVEMLLASIGEAVRRIDSTPEESDVQAVRQLLLEAIKRRESEEPSADSRGS